MYLKAFEFDDLLDSVYNENLIVIVDVTNISRVKPTIYVYCVGGGLSIVQIS